MWPRHIQLGATLLVATFGSVVVFTVTRPPVDPNLQFRHRRVDLPHAPRLVKLGPMSYQAREHTRQGIVNETVTGGGDVTVALPLDDRTDRIPEEGSREILERYNLLPVVSPLLKLPSTMDKGKCQQMHDWQSGHNPTCNVVHESSWGFVHPLGMDSTQVPEEFDYEDVVEGGRLYEDLNEQMRLVAGGAFRWVWMVREYDGTRRALKTLRIDSKSRNFDLRNFDRHRRDAVAMDQLTASPLVVDMYGFCSNSGLFDWGEGGDLSNIFKREPDIAKDHLLQIAYNVTLSLHDAHRIDDQGRSTMAHTDIKPDQFLYQDGYYRLTDFNRVRFLLWNHKKNKKCGFKVAKNGGAWRAPEEYAYELETEEVDVYSLGNVLYFLLTREDPWVGYRAKQIYAKVKDGERPSIPDEFQASDTIFDRYMIQAMKMAWTQDMYERPSALEVAQKLKEGIQEYATKGGRD
jgi:hypothetical protein